MKDKRPINLDLTSLKYPPMAIASILHRISGLIIFLFMPLMIYFLRLSLISEESFNQLHSMLECPLNKVLLWAFSSALVFHVLAGIRHLLMDMGFGEELAAGRRSASAVIFLAIFAIIFLGIWIW